MLQKTSAFLAVSLDQLQPRQVGNTCHRPLGGSSGPSAPLHAKWLVFIMTSFGHLARRHYLVQMLLHLYACTSLAIAPSRGCPDSNPWPGRLPAWHCSDPVLWPSVRQPLLAQVRKFRIVTWKISDTIGIQYKMERRDPLFKHSGKLK